MTALHLCNLLLSEGQVKDPDTGETAVKHVGAPSVPTQEEAPGEGHAEPGVRRT